MSRVLVVDDEMMNRDVIGKIMKKEGIEVLEATNGAEALEHLEREAIDLVLLDLMMPVMDGFETIKAIRTEACYAALPLIVISAVHDTEAMQRALRLGADVCFTKPFDLVELVLVLKCAVISGRSGLSQEQGGQD